MIKILKICLITILLATNAIAGSDGKIELSKKNKTTKDCFEPINRASFALNQGLDKAIFKPVAKGYRALPIPLKTGTGNALNNISNLITIPNNILQGDLKLAAINTGRLVVNTTVGILGIFDVASGMGFPEYVKEDYGQTLGAWGVGPGCYIVLPVLGPSTIRDTAGMFANVMGGDPYYNISVNGNNQYLDGKLYAASKILSAVEFRAMNIDSLDNLEKNSVDFYASVRSLYTQDRENKIKNTERGSIEVIYKEDQDWEEVDTK
jgi:phospholipid-binding lipoprotein MlaA